MTAPLTDAEISALTEWCATSGQVTEQEAARALRQLQAENARLRADIAALTAKKTELPDGY